ncbi:MAG: ABC transporter permease [Defluviitaleaceae bacterium]|nr:ABC transporter permease [Defluviitaleaceae bacterium]
MVAIIKKELRNYFNHITGYIFLFFYTVLMAIFFIMTNVLQQNADYFHTLINAIIIFMLMIPMLTMRLFSEEFAQKTDQLLYTAPISTSSIVFGKFLSACIMLLIGVVITFIFPYLISSYGTLPISRIIGTYIGFYLMGCAFISIGILVSVSTHSQVVAAIGSFAMIFVFFVMGALINAIPATRDAGLIFAAIISAIIGYIFYSSTKNTWASGGVLAGLLSIFGIVYALMPSFYDGLAIRSLQWVSLVSRFRSFSNGILEVADVAYYITFSILFCFFAINIIEKRRWA